MADVVVTFNASGSWLCPDGVTAIKVEAYGGGGGGASGLSTTRARGGGGGGAYAARTAVPVTPGSTYTVTVGTGGGQNVSGGQSTFTGDSSTTITAAGGTAANVETAGPGGTVAASVGTTRNAGGSGGSGAATTAGGAGGGEAGGPEGTGNNGASSVGGSTSGRAGGAGATSGGDGGNGGGHGNVAPLSGQPGSAPGGGGGGSGSTGGVPGHTGGAGANGRIVITYTPPIEPGFIATATQVFVPSLALLLYTDFIASVAQVFAPTLVPPVELPFIASVTQAFPPTLSGATSEVDVPFIASSTVVFEIAAIWRETTGAGNGGETFPGGLAPAGTSVVATLAATIGPTATALELTGDGSLPSTGTFFLTIDAEVLLVTRTSPGAYRIVQRRLSNTAGAAHAAGTDATWDDHYDMAVESTNQIGATVEVDGDTFDAWLIAFDSSQAYLDGDRYATHVAELVGVFPPGTGAAGANRLDAAQPSAAAAPAGVTDDCPVGITVPARVTTDIEEGDVALLRYLNTEADVVTLGPRSSAIQSWYGFMRVDPSNVDVTDTDPAGTVVDAAIDGEFFDEDFITVTLPGDDRTFTYGPPRYSDRGWPIAALAVRQGTRRVPHWTSPDWHNFVFVYSGFSVDATYVQILINRNGFDPVAPLPEVDLPHPDDIDGPNATWDDPAYYTSVAWYVGIFKAAILLTGPTLNENPPPAGTPPPPPSPLPWVPPGPGGGGDVEPPGPSPEGGEGGDIPPPTAAGAAGRFWATLVQ